MLTVRLATRRFLALTLATALVCPLAWSQGSVDEDPHPAAMVGDLLVARPIGVAMTAVGAAAFVVSLPFTLLAGSVSETADTLVLGPAEATFMRCLGCREPGYSRKDLEIRQQRNQRRESEGEGDTDS